MTAVNNAEAEKLLKVINSNGIMNLTTLKEFKSVKELKDELKGLLIEKKQTEELLKTVVDKMKDKSKENPEWYKYF